MQAREQRSGRWGSRLRWVATIVGVGVMSPNALASVGSGPASPLDMFLSAHFVVQGVMLLLVAASIFTWATLFAKLREFREVTQEVNRADHEVNTAESLAELKLADMSVFSFMVDTVWQEIEMSYKRPRTMQLIGIKERAAARLHSSQDLTLAHLGRGLSPIANVASVTPFIGLFGTVWGIMNSFVGIAAAKSTSLAVVAPGIAEALLATGLGLAVAIPATVMHQILSRKLGDLRNLLSGSSTALMCLVSRELEGLDQQNLTPVNLPPRRREKSYA